MTTDVTNATTVYYVPYTGQYIPISTATFGGTYTEYAFGPLTLSLSSTYQTSNHIYDVYAFIVGGSPQIGFNTTPWNSLTGRSSGCDAIKLYNGIWVNSNSFTLVCSFNNGSTIYQSTNAGDATYLGSVYITSNGETTVNFKPSAAAGGTDNVIGIWNAYNRVPAHSICLDSASSWAQTSSGWQEVDSSPSNRITWLDGLQQTSVAARLTTLPQPNAANSSAQIGVDLDGSTATPNVFSDNYYGSNTGYTQLTAQETFTPQPGLHYVQAMQNVGGTGANITFYGFGVYTALTLDFDY